jgi:hypothetical protein
MPLLRPVGDVFPCESPDKFQCNLSRISCEDSDTEAGFSRSTWGFLRPLNIPQQLHNHLLPLLMCYMPNQPVLFHTIDHQLRLRISSSPWLTLLAISHNASLLH